MSRFRIPIEGTLEVDAEDFDAACRTAFNALSEGVAINDLNNIDVVDGVERQCDVCSEWFPDYDTPFCSEECESRRAEAESCPNPDTCRILH